MRSIVQLIDLTVSRYTAQSCQTGNEQVCKVYYFTDYATWMETSYRRHQKYISALQSVGVEPIIGRFKKKKLKCRARCKQEFQTFEEKETDVNVGVYLVADALENKFDRAIVISADSDLFAAVRLARARTSDKQIDIVAPPGRMTKNHEIRPLFSIPKGKIAASRLPETVSLAGGAELAVSKEYE